MTKPFQRQMFSAKEFRAAKGSPEQVQAAAHLNRDVEPETPHRSISGAQFGTLPMFMSAREINRKYEPLSGDFEEREHPRTGHYYTEGKKAFWNRKYDEAFNDRSANGYSGDNADDFDSWGETPIPHSQNPRVEKDFNPNESLGESIIREGVAKPVFLQTQPGPNHWGDVHKPEIVGGHHRVAVMAVHKPDELMPVTHETSIYSAQERPDYR